MNTEASTTDKDFWNPWRIARWTAALALLLTPLVAMQFSDEWNWTIGDFLFAGTAIGAVGLLYEFAERASALKAYRLGAAVALGTCFLTVWTTIVRDDGTGLPYLLLVLAAGMGAFAARMQAAGMARAMLGLAAMQAFNGLAIATAPMTLDSAFGPAKVLVFNGFFAGLWLVAGAFFAAASRSEKQAAS